MLCAVTSGQTRFACHWVSQGHSTVPCEPTPRRESPSRNQASVSGLPSSLGSRPLEKLDQKGKRPLLFFHTKSRTFLATISRNDEIQKTSRVVILKNKILSSREIEQLNWLNKTCNNIIISLETITTDIKLLNNISFLLLLKNCYVVFIYRKRTIDLTRCSE